MEITLKAVSERLQVQPEALRPLLAAGLVPAEKRAGTWWLKEEAVERLVQVLRLLRRPYYRSPESRERPACPNCHQPGFHLRRICLGKFGGSRISDDSGPAQRDHVPEGATEWQCSLCRFRIDQDYR